MRLRFSSISRNDNPQVSFEDVKSAAGQLGFKGKDGLVVEPRTTVRGEDQCEDLGGNGEPRNTVGDVMIREEVEIPDAENGAVGGSKNVSEGNVDGVAKGVGEVSEHEGVGQLDRRGVQGVGGNVQARIQEIVEEVPSGQDEFQGALEEDETASQSVRATSTPVAAGKSLVAHYDNPGPTFSSENNAGETSRVEAPIQQIDENGNQQSEAISEARATSSMGALMVREGTQGGFVEASAFGEQDMDLDLSLMEKTSESQIDLGSGGQGPRSRSRSGSRMMNLLNGSASKRRVQKVGLHDGMLKKALHGKEISKNMNMQEIQGTQQQQVLHKRSNQVATSIGGECRKCGKALRRNKGNLCVECEGVFHVKCSTKKFEGEGWVCKRCKKQGAREKPVQNQGGAGDSAANEGEVTTCSQSVSTKITSGAQEGLVRQVAIGVGEKPSACKNCSGCARKKGCKKVAIWNKAQKQTGWVVVNNSKKVARRSLSVSTNIGRAAPLEGAVKQVATDKKVVNPVSRKRKMVESEASEKAAQRWEEKSNKRARIDKRVGFNKVASVKGRSRSTLGEETRSLGSERPVRSSARKEMGSYWEEPVREERLRCKYCKTSFSAASKLRRWLSLNIHLEFFNS